MKERKTVILTQNLLVFSISLLTSSNKFMIPCCIVTPLVTSLHLSLRPYSTRYVVTPLVTLLHLLLRCYSSRWYLLPSSALGPPMGIRVHSSASLQRYYIINFNLQILISYIFVRPIPQPWVIDQKNPSYIFSPLRNQTYKPKITKRALSD